MAIGDIHGNTAAIKSTASGIRSDASAYGNAVETIFSTVDALRATWTSEDGNAYIARINKYKEEFEKNQQKLMNSADALEDAANSYEQTIKANMG